MEKHNVAMNHNFTAIKKTLDKLSERQDAADEDRKALAKRQLRQDKMMMSMFKGMQKSFPENFVEEEFDDDAHGGHGETINVDAVDQNDSTKSKGATKKPVAKISGGGKTTTTKIRAVREPYPLRNKTPLEETAGALSPAESTQPASGAGDSVSLDPKYCSMTATHSEGGCAWAIEGAGETARLGVVKTQSFEVRDGAAGALCQPFDIVTNSPLVGSAPGFLASDRLFADKEEATGALENFRGAKKGRAQ